ncbi:MAG: regulatory iron-sulfur-containing complex subunit RicT [Bacteroidia bacterium]
MGCGTACGTKPGGCGSSGGCSSGGCNKLNVYDWLSDIELPAIMKPFDVVEVSFKGSRKGYYRNVNAIDLYKDDAVAVEVETGGYDIGRVNVKGELVKLQLKKNGYSEDDPRIKKLYRKATEADLAKWQECKEMEIPTQYRARSLAIDLGLDMKLSDVEYQADRRKATFYYTAETRVDFRELIKRLAETFKVKIEMRQISYREEAGRLGGIGSCGKVLCCSTWLTDFKQVNNSAARYQNLSLNPLKLSGQCGRLKCCLNFELDSYLEALQEFPKDDRLRLEVESGTAFLVKTDILRRLMWFSVQGSDSAQWICLPLAKVREIMEMNARGEKPTHVIEAAADAIVEEEPDFKDMVGEDSITRLDRPKQAKGNRNTNRNRDNRNRNSNSNERGGNSNRPPRSENSANPRREGNAEGGQNRKPRPENNTNKPAEGNNERRNNPNNRRPRPDNPNTPPSDTPSTPPNTEEKREGDTTNRPPRNNENRNRDNNRNRGNRNNRGRDNRNPNKPDAGSPPPPPDQA